MRASYLKQPTTDNKKEETPWEGDPRSLFGRYVCCYLAETFARAA